MLPRGAVRRRSGEAKYLRRAISSGKERRSRRAPLAEFSEDLGVSLAHRIIPCLDTDGERVVKGVNFVGLRDAGDPAALAARYNSEGADELVVLDIAASRDRRPTFLDTIRRVAAELERIGIRIVVYPQDILAASVQAMRAALAGLKGGAKPPMASPAELATAIRSGDYLAQDARWPDPR